MSRVRLRLPATSANLGPGFDTLALALRMHLEIEAEAAGAFSIEASGRNAEACATTKDNLLLATYRTVLEAQRRAIVPLHIRMENEIPLGMGCGSSAAARLAAVALASHFGGLAWSRERILAEACRLEGHPDNAAACWLGGFVASAMDGDAVAAVRFMLPPEWRALLVMPQRPLATTASRAVLPESYGRRDVMANLQRVGLLTAAMATARADLLANAMRDWVHQPYRAEVCPLLGKLLPLAGSHGISGVALSGAGPAVLLLAESADLLAEATRAVHEATQEAGPVELLAFELESESAEFEEVG
ncbi:MAG TPA: homoserine kinase [Acidobacteriaceae bacterium]|nr:homoserine kinase [Acidobacteriaceae bacterium]